MFPELPKVPPPPIPVEVSPKIEPISEPNSFQLGPDSIYESITCINEPITKPTSSPAVDSCSPIKREPTCQKPCCLQSPFYGNLPRREPNIPKLETSCNVSSLSLAGNSTLRKAKKSKKRVSKKYNAREVLQGKG